MTTLHEFHIRYEENVEEVLAQMPELDRREMFRPFWESRFLPADSQQLLMLGEAVPAKTREIMSGLALIALGRFFAEYLADLGAYIKQELGLAVTVEELSAKEQAAALRKKFRKDQLKDPVLSWFLAEGIEAISELLNSLCVGTLDDLAVFVSCLDYRTVFLSGGKEKESCNYLFDALEGLKEDLVEAGLLDFTVRMDELVELEIAKSEKGDVSGQMTGSFGRDPGQLEATYKEVVIRHKEEAAGEENAGEGENSLAFHKVA
jgi:hypothetical protein